MHTLYYYFSVRSGEEKKNNRVMVDGHISRTKFFHSYYVPKSSKSVIKQDKENSIVMIKCKYPRNRHKVQFTPKNNYIPEQQEKNQIKRRPKPYNLVTSCPRLNPYWDQCTTVGYMNDIYNCKILLGDLELDPILPWSFLVHIWWQTGFNINIKTTRTCFVDNDNKNKTSNNIQKKEDKNIQKEEDKKEITTGGIIKVLYLIQRKYHTKQLFNETHWKCAILITKNELPKMMYRIWIKNNNSDFYGLNRKATRDVWIYDSWFYCDGTTPFLSR